MFPIASSAEGALMHAEPLNTLLTAIEQVRTPVWILVVSAAANVVLAVVAALGSLFRGSSDRNRIQASPSGNQGK